MDLVINKAGFNEIVVTEDCEWDDFYLFSDQLKDLLKINYKEKLDDFDSCYWEFDFENTDITINYNVYTGIAIYPKKARLADDRDNQKIIKILNIIKMANLRSELS